MSIQLVSLSDQATIAQYINDYRAKHQAPLLVWDTTVANFSQNWATYLNINNTFTHSGSSQYGEISHFTRDTVQIL